MRIHRELSTCPEPARSAVIALGNFDGMHLGHQAILAHAGQIAKRAGKPLAAMTFEPHPREFFARAHPEKPDDKLRIYPFRRKYELFKAAGVEHLFAVRFNQQLAQTSAEDFVQHILHDTLAAHHIVTGYNFYFGHKRAGDKELLAQESQRLGFGYSAHPPVVDSSGQAVSSSRIRSLLAAGDVVDAASQLGQPYQMSGHVRHGDARGRQLGFPTANILQSRLFLPRFGVYAVRVRLEDGSTHDGVANFGVRPTFGVSSPRLEVHMFDFTGDLYGQRIDVALLGFIRAEQSFSGLDALKAQITADSQQAKKILSQGATA